MYAIISDGAHQYKVEEGQRFEIQRQDVEEGVASITFERILMVGDHPDGAKIGAPLVEGAKVTATILGEIKGDKLIIQKLRRRKGYRLKKGHRQRFLQVRVDKIEA